LNNFTREIRTHENRILINDINTEKDNYTTIRLARRAVSLGHEVALVGLSDLIYDYDESIAAMVTQPQRKEYKDDAQFLAELQHENRKLIRIKLTGYDVVLLRSDPANEVIRRPWAPSSALLFAQLLTNQGVLVLNDPTHLTDASNKTYFQTYPEIVRPKTIICCNIAEIRQAIEYLKGNAVIKPLQGSGGQGVFIINGSGQQNLNQMIEATIRDGYAIVQEYLPEAVNGDLRLITLNGRPLKVDGVYACIRRYNDSGDGRSNISAGGKYEMAEPDDKALKVAEAVAPKLMKDGMYLAGLDIVGDKMMEINVDTPGGINMLDDLTGIDFSGTILADLERKVRLIKMYGQQLTATELAMF
jgi:glutathione synthase